MEHLPFDGWDHGPSKASDTMTLKELLMNGTREEIISTMRAKLMPYIDRLYPDADLAEEAIWSIEDYLAMQPEYDVLYFERIYALAYLALTGGRDGETNRI